MQVKALPALPALAGQPAVVRIYDQVRYELQDDMYGEFGWFAREYPRNFRYYVYRAEHRLKSIHRGYESVRSAFEADHRDTTNVISIGTGRGDAWQVYWDFEDYLSAVSTALDLLARTVGPLFPRQVPPKFTRLCRRADLAGVVDDFRKAQVLWVQRMKDLRDCFVHYTPVDNESMMQANPIAGVLELWARLPTNPNARESDVFRYSRKLDVLRYSLTVHRHLCALDRKRRGT